MKLCVVIFGVLAACAVSYAVERGPLLAALQPGVVYLEQPTVELQSTNRQKRSLLLGAGALALGGGALGLGALGAAGLVGAKAGLVGGLIAGKALSHHGRSYGGYGGYGYSEPYYHSYGGYSGPYYGGYRSYSPSYVVEEEWC